MIGPPGSGKTMLARRMPTILPPLTFEEAIEISQIYSVAGLLPPKKGLITTRQFRSPHHTTSSVALIGGGTFPKPGEISLAHYGVLFLDELPEYHRDVLEVLRQPLEDGVVNISRVKGSISYPARFMLIAAMNPCPCGYLGDRVKNCTCTPYQIQKYRSKISGPLWDRFDIHIEVPRLTPDELSGLRVGEKSEAIRKRVEKGRMIQVERYKKERIFTNAQLSSRLIKKYCILLEEGRLFMKQASEKLSLTARGYDRILKLSRTIADLDGKDDIEIPHLAEAIQYRGIEFTED